ncbi:ThuA domain-containing protein [Dactylosporangium sp. AC04546]|uniref:ThuA domain-containing protein n=1 Tax=Dactylosporangium sp. AC04546 TaxID=2862460 RepID=UPI001EDCA13D|nr:ThuA domain-containing protein [Dactylosporangium sp. AC04546]WVK81380.1 ThuA domain-containing protein [Dactylosporangium sp. AC04546]
MRRILAALALAAAATLTAVTPAYAAPAFKVLVFTKTAGFRHGSIPAGVAAVQQLGAANNFAVDATEDAGAFTTGNLSQYKAVIWLSTTGDVLNDAQQAAFQSYVRAGGGYTGVHAAADTEYGWAWYGGLVGAYFSSHPANQTATVRVADRAHPSTSHLAPTWSRLDEWYNYATNPRANVKVLATLDESTYSGGTMGADHPITWCQGYDGGRAWYTGMGHTDESWADPSFTRMLLGGIRWAAGAAAGDCRPESGYTALFDGTQASLDRWRMAGPGGFTLADGTLSSFGGMGLLWYPVSPFANYSLKVDWMMPGDDNGGVFIGFPDPGNDPWGPVNAGHEIQIDATDGDPTRTTGSVYSFKAPDTALRAANLNPPGSWNTYDVQVHGQHVEVYLNGVEVNDYMSTRNIASGYVGVQNDGDAAHISYRNIRIKTDGPPPATDVARGRPVTVSSVEPGSPHTGANAVDGNAATRWGSAYSDPQWIAVDLGSTYTLNRVRLNWETAYGRAYQIQTSVDGSTWTTVYSTTTGDGGVDDLTVTGTGRYVRVYGTQRATQWGYSLWDLNVYGTASAGLLSQGRPVSASSVEPGSPHAAANAVDGNTATRWGSAYSDPQWISVDLGSVRTINRVRLNWETAYGRAYQIQTSVDGSTWTNIYSTTTGDGGIDDLTVTGNGRYVRVNGTQRATQWGYSLWELEVYGG